jgi:hypothetical protein
LRQRRYDRRWITSPPTASPDWQIVLLIKRLAPGWDELIMSRGLVRLLQSAALESRVHTASSLFLMWDVRVNRAIVLERVCWYGQFAQVQLGWLCVGDGVAHAADGTMLDAAWNRNIGILESSATKRRATAWRYVDGAGRAVRWSNAVLRTVSACGPYRVDAEEVDS